MTSEDYGIINTLQVLSAIIVIFFTLNIDRAVYRLYHDYTSEDDKQAYLGSIFLIMSIISTIVLVILLLFPQIISILFESIAFKPYIILSILTTYISTFQIVPQIIFQLRDKAKQHLIFSLCKTILTTGLTLWFVLHRHEGAIGFLKSQLIGALVITPFLLPYTFSEVKFQVRKHHIIESIKISAPLIPTILSAWILNLSDRIFIERYLSLSEVGIYSLGYKIASLLLVVSAGFGIAYSPIFFQLANDEKISAKKYLQKYNELYLMFILVLGFLLSLFAKEIITVLFSSIYTSASGIIIIIIASLIFSETTGLLSKMYMQTKKVSMIMYIQITSAILNIIFNAMLIPQYGIYGAAYATLLSFMFNFAMFIKYRKYSYYIAFNWKSLGEVFALLAIPIAIFSIDNELSTLHSIAIKTIVALLLLLFIYKKYIISILMRKIPEFNP